MAGAIEQWIHMVGIAGAGMSGIARILAEQGARVSGSDLNQNNVTKALEAIGVTIYKGHVPSNVQEGVDLLVISSAVPEDNVEVQAARNRGIPVIKRGQMLARLVNDRKTIAVAGAHGKTTTTSMIYTVLNSCGLDPTFIVGGELQNGQTGARLGQSQYAVVEADESDASFLELKPYYAVVTNIEDDHLDFYRSVDNIHKAFNKYIDGVKTGGLAVVYGEDESIKVIADMTPTRLVTYGEAENNDYYFRNWTAAGMGSVFEIYHNRKLLGQVELSIPGRHNALNATSAVAVAMEMGLDFAAVSRAIKEFHGAKRRFEVIGQEKNITVVDDYAHHPTEIQATIEAARSYQSQGRVVVLFQPHRYSRTQLLGKQLGEALAAADLVVVTDVYSAGENKIPGIDGSLVEKAARHAGASSVYCSSWQEAERYLISEIRNNDLIITMGAGDIWKMGPQLLEKCQCSV